MNKTLSILGMSLLTVACSDGGKTDTAGDGSPQSPNLTNPESSIVRQIQSSPLLDDGCVNGGSVFEFGFDFNANGALDDAEVDSERTKILCHGEEGQVGYSAFQIWTMAGNEGSEADFLASLVGTNGVSGDDGSSAYDIWLAAGNTGTEVDFLASLVGTAGHAGTDGLSAYEIWLAAGNAGSEADFLASLEGADGNTGTDGSNGLSAPAITSSSFFYINENTQESYTVTAFDADEGDELSFAIVGGEDAELFDINTESGIISFKDSPDYEVPTDRDENNVYEIDLSVTDGTYTTTKALLVKVRNFEIIPAISTVGINSTPANEEYYTAGEIVIATVTFDYPVSVVGSPQLALTMGDQVRIANYLPDDSNETVFHFSYSVVAEDREGEGIRINENALSLNGSIIASTNLLDGLAASLMSEGVVSDQLVEDEAPVLIGSSTTSKFSQIIPAIGLDNQNVEQLANTVIIDKEGDGDNDILYISDEYQEVSWLINDNGEINQLQREATNFFHINSAVNAAYINEDEFADILVVNDGLKPFPTRDQNNMTIYLSDGLEGYNSQTLNFRTSEFSSDSAYFVDMDDDKDLDIVVSIARGLDVDFDEDLGIGTGVKNLTGRILILINDGSNVFSENNVRYAGELADKSGYMLNVVDLDGDKKPEIIATSASGSHQAKLFKNMTKASDSVILKEQELGFNLDATGKKSVHLDSNGDGLQDILISGPRTAVGSETVLNPNSLTLLKTNKTTGEEGEIIFSFDVIDFNVPSSIGILGAGDLDGDDIDDFAYKTLTYSAWYKGDGAGGFTKFDRSHFRTNDQAELSMELSIGNLTGNKINDNDLNDVVSLLGRGNDKYDSTQACNWCLDIWQNTPSYDLKLPAHTAADTILTEFTAEDVDSNVTFSLSGPDHLLFAVDAEGKLSVTVSLDYEDPQDSAATMMENADEATNLNAVADDNFYQLSIVISDGPNSVSTPITVLVTDVVVEEAAEVIE